MKRVGRRENRTRRKKGQEERTEREENKMYVIQHEEHFWDDFW